MSMQAHQHALSTSECPTESGSHRLSRWGLYGPSLSRTPSCVQTLGSLGCHASEAIWEPLEPFEQHKRPDQVSLPKARAREKYYRPHSSRTTHPNTTTFNHAVQKHHQPPVPQLQVMLLPSVRHSLSKNWNVPQRSPTKSVPAHFSSGNMWLQSWCLHTNSHL